MREHRRERTRASARREAAQPLERTRGTHRAGARRGCGDEAEACSALRTHDDVVAADLARHEPGLVAGDHPSRRAARVRRAGVMGAGCRERREVGGLLGTMTGELGTRQRDDGEEQHEDGCDDPGAEHGARAALLPGPAQRGAQPVAPRAVPVASGPRDHGSPISSGARAVALLRNDARPGTRWCTARVTVTVAHPSSCSTITCASGPASS